MNKTVIPESKDLLELSKKVLRNEGSDLSNEISSIEKLEKYILPGLQNSKNILASLYSWQPNEKNGVIGKAKNKVLLKIKNIIINVVERPAMKQQKFNDLVFEAIKEMKDSLEKKN